MGNIRSIYGLYGDNGTHNENYFSRIGHTLGYVLGYISMSIRVI